MRLVYFGDVMGKSGRIGLETHFSVVMESLSPDFVMVNGENAAHGFGITEKICTQFFDLGVDVITTGNHVWDQREIINYIEGPEAAAIAKLIVHETHRPSVVDGFRHGQRFGFLPI